MFAWLRSKVRAAILDGVQDAITALDGGAVEPAPVDLPEVLRQRFAAALPASGEEKVHVNGKARAKA